MQIRDVRSLVSFGYALRVEVEEYPGDGWLCRVYRQDAERAGVAHPELETSRGELRYFRSLDSVSATLRQCGVKQFEVVLSW